MAAGRWILGAASAAVLALCGAGAAQAVDAGAPPSPALWGDLHWRLLGPFRAGWGEMVEGIPSRPNTYLFGASGGGIWRTDDAGRTWRSIFDKGPAPVGAIAIAPSNPDVIYAGTGQPEPRYDVAAGEGVFRSDDGGKSWRSLGLADTKYIGRIWVSPTDPNTVVVGAVGHFFGPSPARGVFRSTDGGKTWTQTLKIDDATGVADLASDPKDPNVLFAASWTARQYPWQSYFTKVAGTGSALWRSSDGGATWTRLGGAGWPTGPLGRISVATARTAKGLRLYAVIDSDEHGGLWRSDDGGASWTRVNKSDAFTSWYQSRVTVDPADPDVVWLVGQSIRRCTEGGAKCEIFKGAPGGDDYHHIWINPLHPDHIATASDQGTVISVDGGRSWSSWYNQPTGQFYHLAADNRFPYWIYSGQQDSGTVGIASRSDYGQLTFRDWNPVGGDERDYDVPDQTDPNIVYGTGLGGHVSKWDARTGQVQNIAPWPVSSYGKRPTLYKYHYLWVTPLAASQTGTPTIYLGAQVLFASTDRGEHWSVISPDLTGKVEGAKRCGGDVALADARPCGYGGIWTIAPSSRHAGEIWVGADDGLVHVTRDGGKSWADVTPPGIPAWAKISSIDVSAAEDDVAYVTVDGQRLDDFQPHVFRTRDGGKSWTDISAGLPRGHFVDVVRADPVKPGLLYAGSDAAVFVSFDDGAHWSPLQQNLPTAWVRDLLVHGNDLVAGTQGRAIWALDDVSPLRQLTAQVAAEPAHLFTPATAVRVHPNNNKDTPLPPETPAGQNPPGGAVLDYWLGAPAKGAVEIDILDAKGRLVRRLTSTPEQRPDAEAYFSRLYVHPDPGLPRTAGHHRVVWDLHGERPHAINFDYSIAAIAGQDTPILPQGPWATPGEYTVVLKVDGHEQRAPLTIVEDPRVKATQADLDASLAFSDALEAKMKVSWRGYAEMAAAHEQLEKLAKSAQPAIAARARALAKATASVPNDQTSFGFTNGVLAGMETDLESADAAPLPAQREVFEDMSARIDAAWSKWTGVRDHDLAAFDAELKRAGLKPVVLPTGDRLKVEAPDGGQDLP
jgi:photosystem II stability/assembly factor-like uncharacterized protein